MYRRVSSLALHLPHVLPLTRSLTAFIPTSTMRMEVAMNRGFFKRACSLVVSGVMCTVGLTGCGEVEEYEEDVVEEGRTEFDNGINFNGINFNGINFNGINFNGIWTQAIPGWLQYLQFLLNGQLLQNPHMEGNMLRAFYNGQWISGPQLEGSILGVSYFEDLEGRFPTLVQFLLDNYLSIKTGLGTHLTAFHAMWRMPGHEELFFWQPMCPDGNPAVILEGTWDPVTWDRISGDGMTLACVGGILADCAIWGYDPAETYSGEDLAYYHDACARAKPGDYCGDRTPHTVPGTPVDFYDDLDIQSQESGWDIEAMWDENGAICLNEPRKTAYTKDPMGTIYIGCVLPDCVDVDMDGDIDFDDYPSAKIATRATPS